MSNLKEMSGHDITALITTVTASLKTLYPEANISIGDDTAKHRRHKQYNGGAHLVLTINDPSLKQQPRIKAHQQIYSCLSPWMGSEIHALSIKII